MAYDGRSPATEEITQLRNRLAFLEANTPTPALPPPGEETFFARRADRNYRHNLITSMDQEFNVGEQGGELATLSLVGLPDLVNRPRRREARSEGGRPLEPAPADIRPTAESRPVERPAPGVTRVGGVEPIIVPPRTQAQPEPAPPTLPPVAGVLVPPPTNTFAERRRQRINTRQGVFEGECTRCLKGRVSVRLVTSVARELWYATSGNNPEDVETILARHCHPSEAELSWIAGLDAITPADLIEVLVQKLASVPEYLRAAWADFELRGGVLPEADDASLATSSRSIPPQRRVERQSPPPPGTRPAEPNSTPPC
jgi:hypothetical protein